MKPKSFQYTQFCFHLNLQGERWSASRLLFHAFIVFRDTCQEGFSQHCFPPSSWLLWKKLSRSCSWSLPTHWLQIEHKCALRQIDKGGQRDGPTKTTGPPEWWEIKSRGEGLIAAVFHESLENRPWFGPIICLHIGFLYNVYTIYVYVWFCIWLLLFCSLAKLCKVRFCFLILSI